MPKKKSKKTIFKQIEELYTFDAKESSFFKFPRKEVEAKKNILRFRRKVINTGYGERKGFEIHTHYYKEKIIPSVLDVYKQFSSKRTFSDMVVVVSEKAVLGGVIFKVNPKIMEQKIEELSKNNNFFKKILLKFNKDKNYSTLNYFTLKKYIHEKTIIRIKQEAKNKNLEKQLNKYPNISKKDKLLLKGIEQNATLEIFKDFGINIKFIPNEGYIFNSKLVAFTPKKK